MQEIKHFIDSLETYESRHEQKLYFLKEAFSANDYLIHPNMIAHNWLISLCFNKPVKDDAWI